MTWASYTEVGEARDRSSGSTDKAGLMLRPNKENNYTGIQQPQLEMKTCHQYPALNIHNNVQVL